MAPEPLHMSFVEIGDLPLYNQDLETATPPAPWRAFRDAVRAADALLFVTPEYNRSMPGGLKNAIDVGSRPTEGERVGRKPAAVISVTPGALGAFGANHALRQSLVAVNVATMAGPEAYIGQAGVAVRRRRQARQRRHARLPGQVPAGVREVDRAQRGLKSRRQRRSFAAIRPSPGNPRAARAGTTCACRFGDARSPAFARGASALCFDPGARVVADVHALADQRMPELGQVDSDLMLAPGLEAAFDQRGARKGRDRPDVRHRRFASTGTSPLWRRKTPWSRAFRRRDRGGDASRSALPGPIPCAMA